VSPRKVQLLAEFPLIFFEAGEPCGLTGWLPKGEDLGASTDELVKNVNAFACKNMKGIKVVLPDESLHVASALSPQTLAKSRVSLSFGG
jgi:hypothetical protein